MVLFEDLKPRVQKNQSSLVPYLGGVECKVFLSHSVLYDNFDDDYVSMWIE